MSRDKWEYRIVEGGTGMSGQALRDASTDVLNRLGMDGWECFHAKTDTVPTIFYLKRRR